MMSQIKTKVKDLSSNACFFKHGQICSTVNRNMLLVWDPRGKVVSAVSNLPWNFHDSKSTLWCYAHDHTITLPYGNVLACNSAFVTSENLKGKMVKLKETILEDGKESMDEDKVPTDARICSDRSSDILTMSFRRLRVKILTDNLMRAPL